MEGHGKGRDGNLRRKSKRRSGLSCTCILGYMGKACGSGRRVQGDVKTSSLWDPNELPESIPWRDPWGCNMLIRSLVRIKRHLCGFLWRKMSVDCWQPT